MSVRDFTRIRLRDLGVGALLSLVVTVLGGIVVYFLTRGKPPSSPAERLRYSVQAPTRFEAQRTELAITGVTLVNAGDAAAKNVTVAVAHAQGATLQNFNVQFSSGPAAKYTSARQPPPELELAIPSLAPGETATITLLYRGRLTEAPAIGVKSEASVGVLGSLAPQSPPTDKGKPLAGLIGGAAAQGAVILLFLVYLWRRRGAFGSFRNINNTAFLYLHTGLPNEAHALLLSGIEQGGADAFMSANYALATDYLGQRDTADKLFRAAEFYASGRHERAVVSFSKAIALFGRGDIDGGTAALDDALSRSKKEIERYCTLSTLVADLRRQSRPVGEALAARHL